MSYLDIAKGLHIADTSTYRAFRAPDETQSSPVVDSQESQCSCAVSAKSAVSPDPAHSPLDPVIAEDVATKHTREEITARAERLAARAVMPDATVLDIAVAADWRRILAAKEANE